MGKSVYLIGLIATIAIFVVVIFTIKSFEDSRFYEMNEQLKQISITYACTVRQFAPNFNQISRKFNMSGTAVGEAV